MMTALEKAIEVVQRLHKEDSDHTWRLERHLIYPLRSDGIIPELSDYENPMARFAFIATHRQDGLKAWQFFIYEHSVERMSFDEMMTEGYELATEVRRAVAYLISEGLKYPPGVSPIPRWTIIGR